MVTEKEVSAARGRQVKKSNELIQKARYKLSLPGQKILLYLITLIPEGATEFAPMMFSIPDFCRVCDIQAEGGNYKLLEDALSDLLTDSARIWITLENGKRVPIMWIEKPYIDTLTGKLMVKLDNDMKPYLLNLKGHWTHYELIYTLRFKSKYSIRLYEIVKSYHYHNDQPRIQVLSVDDLRALLDAEIYSEYRDFKRRVLSIAISEINQYTDRDLEIREIKSGRKVQEIEFTISCKSDEALAEVRKLIGAPPPRRKRKPRQIDGQMSIPGMTTETRTATEKLDAMRRMHEHLKNQGTTTADGYSTIPGAQT